MGNCFCKNKKHILILFRKKQIKEEFNKTRISIDKIGNYTPHSVYSGSSILLND
jgi:hypothetical protein